MRGGEVLILCVALASGCAAVPPPPLDADERWRSVMRSGHQKSRGRLFVPRPTLIVKADVEAVDGLRVFTDPHGLSWHWPDAFAPGFEEELQQILSVNTGYELTNWRQSTEAPEGSQFELRLVVSDYRLVLLDSGLGTSMATLWLWGMLHLATFYNAPDEIYLCEYEAQVSLVDVEADSVVASRTLRGSKELALTDFQRGWSLWSYWPSQRLQWLPGQDAVSAWRSYAGSVIEACEPHARRGLLLELLRFLREQPMAPEPPQESSKPPNRPG